MKTNSPHVAGVPITFQRGDRVVTRDGRYGTVKESRWERYLVLYKDGRLQRGIF